MHAALDAQARSWEHDGTGRTLPQRRADALVHLVTTRDGSARVAASVDVVVPLDVLTGQSSQPGSIAGIGPAPASAVRRLALAKGATWRRIVTDPATGQVVDVGRRRYRPTAALADTVRYRERRCTFPACRMPARRCDVDHLQAWADGGCTDACNLQPLCRHHHRVKHEAGWAVAWNRRTGGTTWTSPSGRRYTNHPDDLI
ncbi:hypothetical protein BIV57_22790 [Mangrovactinospora gilvigrisea]|uniref:HNH nuclease domain-containing protein n=1 Tax=Mangrovactinospora gilvigrisea TaxID=1428644 RepID=A0A1J7B9E7_9ACTN|nr:hypothetical protein BIV57_22790 [Mangrovactinospora gilvigrisea]